jgi:putative phosphoribosyl transferase
MAGNVSDTATTIRTGVVGLEADLAVPRDATGVVVFAHGSGSGRLSPRNRMVASRLQQAGLGTLLFDLLTPAEDAVYSNRFDIPLLASRLLTATSWLREQPGLENVGVGYFGASTGAAAALVAAAELDGTISAVVSRGGRPDLAGDSLPRVTAPVLLIVGGDDPVVIEMNRDAFARLGVEKRLDIVPGATHLFEEPGTLEQVAELATGWFAEHLG